MASGRGRRGELHVNADEEADDGAVVDVRFYPISGLVHSLILVSLRSEHARRDSAGPGWTIVLWRPGCVPAVAQAGREGAVACRHPSRSPGPVTHVRPAPQEAIATLT